MVLHQDSEMNAGSKYMILPMIDFGLTIKQVDATVGKAIDTEISLVLANTRMEEMRHDAKSCRYYYLVASLPSSFFVHSSSPPRYRYTTRESNPLHRSSAIALV